MMAARTGKTIWSHRPIAGMVQQMLNRDEAGSTARAISFGAVRAALMAAFALAALTACKSTQRTLFLTFAGETPGTRTPFVEIAGAPRLGRPPPAPPAARFRPAAVRDPQPGGDAVVANAHRQVKQALADRDEEFALRIRSLALYAKNYLEAAGALTPQAGDPLPEDNAGFQARMKAARDALDDIDSDIAKLNALILRLQRDRIATRRVAAAAQGRGDALAAAAGVTAVTAGRLMATARAFTGDWLVYVSGQRETLNRLAAQVAAATGPDTVVTIPVRQTLAE